MNGATPANLVIGTDSQSFSNIPDEIKDVLRELSFNRPAVDLYVNGNQVPLFPASPAAAPLLIADYLLKPDPRFCTEGGILMICNRDLDIPTAVADAIATGLAFKKDRVVLEFGGVQIEVFNNEGAAERAQQALLTAVLKSENPTRLHSGLPGDREDIYHLACAVSRLLGREVTVDVGYRQSHEVTATPQSTPEDLHIALMSRL